jgi:hypothetical protein
MHTKLSLKSMSATDAALQPTFSSRDLAEPVPRFELPDREMAPRNAYQGTGRSRPPR